MYETMILGFLQNIHCLIIADIMATVGFHQILGHVSYADTPIAIIVSTALFKFLAAVSARADTHGKVAFIAFEPIRDMLDIGGFVHHADGFLNRNHMHAYA